MMMTDDGPLKLVDKFTYLGSSISLTEIDVNMCHVPSEGMNRYQPYESLVYPIK